MAFQLTNLRALELKGGASCLPPMSLRSTLAASLEARLSRLTALETLRLDLYRLRHFPNYCECQTSPPSLTKQLNSLRITDPGAMGQLRAVAEAEWAAVAAAARRMPNLSELRVPVEANAGDLAALTSLTCLRVGALALPRGGHSARAPTCALPPSLRRLETHTPMPVHVVAALQPAAPGERPCSLMAGGRLWDLEDSPWCLEFQAGDVDEQSRLTALAAANMKLAAGVLWRLGFRHEPLWRGDDFPGLHVKVSNPGGLTVLPPAPGDAADPRHSGSHVESWLGSLAPLRLEGLVLAGWTLPARDLLGLARCMRTLTRLDLRGTSYTVGSLQHLATLPELSRLYVSNQDWEWPGQMHEGEAYGEEVVESAFLALTASVPTASGPAGAEGGEAPAEAAAQNGGWVPLPKLQLLEVEYPDGVFVESLERALAPARQELAARGTGADLRLVAF
ncbi:hypothetical protein GPECTOR_7g1331 [Gonium pectorale]|uniref:Uncharacterized protein n=1 Tax=Gonium pectorale TaxID=33097 RepID=A0A150GUK8_GONPE|nr:hypothetical protein GPECTOR_7g1331 [Gonium pectorale]|eukprot:KXZ53433.1 hypothetical protein GPECTOR_7g1331 [Gonium pectorale]